MLEQHRESFHFGTRQRLPQIIFESLKKIVKFNLKFWKYQIKGKPKRNEERLENFPIEK